MTEQAAWPHKWFGCWREDGEGYEKCPSITSWPTGKPPDEEVATVVASLAQGQVVCVSQTLGRSCHLCKHEFEPSLSWLSDGVWLWPEDLVHYYQDHYLSLPEDLRKRLLAYDVDNPPHVDSKALDWPD